MEKVSTLKLYQPDVASLAYRRREDTMRDGLNKIDQAERDCREDSTDEDRAPDERLFYAGQAEGYRLAAQWIRESVAAENPSPDRLT